MRSGISKILSNKRRRKEIESIGTEKMTERNREVFFNSRFFTERVPTEKQEKETRIKRVVNQTEREESEEKRQNSRESRWKTQQEELPKAPRIVYREEAAPQENPLPNPRLGEKSEQKSQERYDLTQQETLSEQVERISQEVRRISYRYGVGMEDWQFDEFAV